MSCCGLVFWDICFIWWCFGVGVEWVYYVWVLRFLFCSYVCGCCVLVCVWEIFGGCWGSVLCLGGGVCFWILVSLSWVWLYVDFCVVFDWFMGLGFDFFVFFISGVFYVCVLDLMWFYINLFLWDFGFCLVILW